MGYFIQKIEGLLGRVALSCLEKKFDIIISYDKIARNVVTGVDLSIEPRVYIQIRYVSACNRRGLEEIWKGRKWYLSEFMTDSEIMFTAFSAFKACVEHEMMEGFRVDDKVLVNPHVDFEELLKISNKEVKRN